MRAKKLGAKIFVENASSHPLTQKKLLEDEYKKFGLRGFLAFSDKQLKRALLELNQADYVMVPRGFAYNSFIEHGFAKKKLIPVSFGINLDKFKDFRIKKMDNKFRAIFVGQVTLRKGIQYLLQAWEELNLKNSELLVVGNICADMKDLVGDYIHNPSIKFIGFDPDLKKHYQNSDVFVFPSIEEGSALVNYEAMACGLPLITTFNSGTLVRDNIDGFIIPIRDVATLKEKIKWMYLHPSERLKMGKNGKRFVRRFSWDRYGQSVVDAYKSALNKK
jgi:glycosyltransferase involved in cell wall biosynthesis